MHSTKLLNSRVLLFHTPPAIIQVVSFNSMSGIKQSASIWFWFWCEVMEGQFYLHKWTIPTFHSSSDPIMLKSAQLLMNLCILFQLKSKGHPISSFICSSARCQKLITTILRLWLAWICKIFMLSQAWLLAWFIYWLWTALDEFSRMKE